MLKSNTKGTSLLGLVDLSTVKNLSWLAVGANFRQLVIFVLNIHIAKALGESYFGLVSFGYAVMFVFAGLGDFGIRSIAWRELARAGGESTEFNALTGQYIASRIINSLAAAVLFTLFVLLLDRPPHEKQILVLFGIGIFFNQITFDWPFRAVDRMNIPAIASIIFSVVFLVAGVSLIQGPEDAYWFPALFGLANVLSTVYLAYVYVRSFGRPALGTSVDKFFRLMRDSFALGVNAIVIRLLPGFPLILLGLMMDDAFVGKFRAAHLIYTFIISFNIYFAGSIFSRVAACFARGDFEDISASIRRSVYLSLAIFVPLCAAIYLFSGEIIGLLFGGDYSAEGGELLSILVLVAPITIINYLLRELLVAVNRQAGMLKLNILAVIILAVVITPLTAYYGLYGMVYGVVIADALSFATTYYYYRLHVGQLEAA